MTPQWAPPVAADNTAGRVSAAAVFGRAAAGERRGWIPREGPTRSLATRGRRADLVRPPTDDDCCLPTDQPHAGLVYRPGYIRYTGSCVWDDLAVSGLHLYPSPIHATLHHPQLERSAYMGEGMAPHAITLLIVLELRKKKQRIVLRRSKSVCDFISLDYVC